MRTFEDGTDVPVTGGTNEVGRSIAHAAIEAGPDKPAAPLDTQATDEGPEGRGPCGNPAGTTTVVP